MGKEVVTVCLGPVEPADVHAALEEALAPFHLEAEGPRGGQWDEWHIGAGKAEQGYRVLGSLVDDPRLIRNPVFASGRARELCRDRCDGGPRGLLDFDTDRERARFEAESNWRFLARTAAEHPPAERLQTFFDRFEASSDYSIAQARLDHIRQPFVHAVMSVLGHGEGFMTQISHDPVEWLDLGHDVYVGHAVATRVPTLTLITREGEWVDDWVAGGTIRESWRARVAYYIKADDYLFHQDPDALIVRVLCHV